MFYVIKKDFQKHLKLQQKLLKLINKRLKKKRKQLITSQETIANQLRYQHIIDEIKDKKDQMDMSKAKDLPYSHNSLKKVDVKSDKGIVLTPQSKRHAVPQVQSGIKDVEEYNNTEAYDKKLERKSILRSKSNRRICISKILNTSKHQCIREERNKTLISINKL